MKRLVIALSLDGGGKRKIKVCQEEETLDNFAHFCGGEQRAGGGRRVRGPHLRLPRRQ